MSFVMRVVQTLKIGALATAATVTAVQADDSKPTRLTVQGAYGGMVHLLGTAPKAMTERLKETSGGQVVLRWQEPNSLVPPAQAFDSISNGALDASWGTPGDWTGKDPAFALFTSVPFGPGSVEYISWIKHGGGEELMNELYGRYGITAIPCGVVPSEASGWFREKITKVEDLSGLKMRFFGIAGRVMEKLGVATQLVPAGEIFQSLQLGTIDATEFAVPSMDVNLGFQQVAKYYYFPGWHQPTSQNVLMINSAKWAEMPEAHQLAIRSACDDVIAEMLFEGEAVQGAALAKIAAAGAEINVWPPEILAVFREKWDEVAAEESANNEIFARTLASISTFHADFDQWKQLSAGTLPAALQ